MGHALALVQDMEAALGRSETDLSPWFHEDFAWDGNRGCGVKRGLPEFLSGWQSRWRAFLSDRSYHTVQWMEDGDWAACFGEAHGTHSGPLMGIAATGNTLRVPYIDFWQVRDGRIAYNKVSVDLAEALHQLGHDVFGGHGWDASDVVKAV
ncbi:putative ester cyclase [Loktanella sp. PT4BL]|jgi:predicted ester cyclase|uniref:ester cyclase n=1 Tax=Loktanella sp. PT4BL TaxID=2135611 RepID=UPI000D767034|nr:ester cyclase [Loktanella sp. PT4BL]PXW66086.1 putative ester cyclase [Loktanella sp. PT4BL]